MENLEIGEDNFKDTKIGKLKGFGWEEFFFKFRYQILFLLIGTIFVGLGLFFIKKEDSNFNGVEILETAKNDERVGVIVEVSGAVETPGVYKLDSEARVEDALIAAGGISAKADRDWMEKFLNRASVLVDGQKVYIPRTSEQSGVLSAENPSTYQSGSSTFGGQGSGLININTAAQKELESLWGIGPVYAQNIIEQRPYSSVEELLSKKIIKSNVYERNKDKMTVY